MRLLLLLTLLASIGLAHAVDHERERRWAEEILPAVLDGDPVWLEQPGGHRFLGLHIEADAPRAAIILAHGMGVHPDWGINSALRIRLAERGYSTLSIQMPVLEAGAGPGDYVETFEDASERIALAADWLKSKGHDRIAIVSHSLGGRMVRAHFQTDAATPLLGWAALSMGFDDYADVKVPVLDIYVEQDHMPVLHMVDARKRTLSHPASVQHMVPAAGHFYEDREAEVSELVREWLDRAL